MLNGSLHVHLVLFERYERKAFLTHAKVEIHIYYSGNFSALDVSTSSVGNAIGPGSILEVIVSFERLHVLVTFRIAKLFALCFIDNKERKRTSTLCINSNEIVMRDSTEQRKRDDK